MEQQQKQMTAEQAINLIAQITGDISLKRNEHDAVVQAIQVLASAAGFKSQPEVVEGDVQGA